MIRRALVVALLALALAAPAGPASASSCPSGWGSLPRSAGPGPNASMWVTDARTGRHDCYDRFVVDVGVGPPVGYRVRYVGGEPLLRIAVNGSAYDYHGDPTYPGVVGEPLPGVDLTGYRTFRSARYGGSFEAVTTFRLRVRARLPFRVFTLSGRVVVDVAHHW